MPRAVKHFIFEALGSQVGQQRAMADHLDVQSATLGAQVSPKKMPKGATLNNFLASFFGSHSERTFGGFQTQNCSQNVAQNETLAQMADLAQV